MRTHRVFGHDGVQLMEMDDPRGTYVYPAENVEDICAETNELCVLPGDVVRSGEIGGKYGPPHTVYFNTDAQGQIASFMTFFDLRVWLADRHTAHLEAA